MNNKFYIIPGWTETCRRRQYQNLAKAVRKNGLEVVFRNIDWNKNLSKQIFEIEKDSILFGFSMGAIVARLVAQEYKCKLIIFASMTPLRHFRGGEQEKFLVDAIGKRVVADVKKHLKSEIKSKKILMYGDKENEKADIVVKNTGHEISEDYIKEILKLI